MPRARSIGLIWLVATVFVPVARAETSPPAAAAAPASEAPAEGRAPLEPLGTVDVRQLLLRNGVRFCTFCVREDANAILVRDVYGNTRSIPRSEIAQMHTGSRARRMCDKHMVRPPTPAPASPSAPPTHAPAASLAIGAKSAQTALALSLMVPVGTGVLAHAVSRMGANSQGAAQAGSLLLSAAMTVGPAAGHLYTGEYGRALGSSLGRAMGLGLAAFGAGQICPGGCGEGGESGIVLVALGVGTWLVLTVADIVDAPASARRANATGKPTLTLAPMLLEERERGLRPVLFTGLRLTAAY